MNIYTKLMNAIDVITYSAAVTFLVVLMGGCLACLGAWVFGAL